MLFLISLFKLALISLDPRPPPPLPPPSASTSGLSTTTGRLQSLHDHRPPPPPVPIALWVSVQLKHRSSFNIESFPFEQSDPGINSLSISFHSSNPSFSRHTMTKEGGPSVNLNSSQYPAMTDTSTPDTAIAPEEESESTSAMLRGGTSGKVYSLVWMHYERLEVEGKHKAKCNYCGRILGGLPRTGTTSLWKHLERCPERKFNDMRQQVLQGVSRSLTSVFTYLFVYVPCPHTAEVLYEVLLGCLLDWNLDRKLSTITVDNCSTNDAMMTSLKDKLSRLHPEDLLAGGDLIHMRCGAHILNLIVKEGLDVIEVVIERVHDSVAFWVGTQKRWEKFEDTARQLKVTIGKKLILDCKTSWNSTYLMLHTALEYKDVFTRLVLRESKFTCAPDENDWNIAKEICCRLEVFYNATNAFSGTAYPTANLFFPMICEIKVSLKQWNSCGIEVIEKMSSGMVNKFEKCWSQVHVLLGVGVVFDPRYKTDFMECYFAAIYGEKSESEVDRIVSMSRALVKQFEEREEIEKLNDVGQTQSQSQGISEMKASPVIGNTSRFKEFTSKRKRRPTRSELDVYIEDDLIPMEEDDFDVLVWWKSNKHKYPILSKIARDVLPIPVSTVASESAFSTSGRVISPHRSRLLPETTEALMCARSWFLSELKGDLLEELTLASVSEDLDTDHSTMTTVSV